MEELIDTMANIEYGILIAVVLDIIMLVAIAAFNDKGKFNVLSFIIAAIILVPIALQMSRLVGACNLSKTTTTVKNIVGSVSPTLSHYMPFISRHDIGWFIFFRIIWSLLCLVVGGIGIWMTMSKNRKKNHVTFDDYDSNVSSSTDEWGL